MRGLAWALAAGRRGRPIPYPTPAQSNIFGAGRVFMWPHCSLNATALGRLFQECRAEQRRHACGGIALSLVPP